MIIAQSTVVQGPMTRPHRVVLYRRDNAFQPYVVHYQGEEDGSKFQGSYCASIVEASIEFERRCKLQNVHDAALSSVVVAYAKKGGG